MPMKIRPVGIAVVLALLITGAVSCRYVMPERYATYTGGRVNVDLPSGTKNADRDMGVDRETSVVISLPNDNRIFIGKSQSPITKEDLRYRLQELLRDRGASDEMVYVAAARFNNYASIVEVLNEIRKQKASRAGLLAFRLGAEGPARFAVEIPKEPDPSDYELVRPNPLTLVVSVTPDLKLKLNQEDYGSVSDPDPLSAKLAEIFRLREEQFALKPGLETRSDLPLSERIEKTLIIKAARSIKYGDVIKIIDAVKGGGAVPIVLQIDDLAP
jgi:biopolymer transport protein ExbD